MLLAEQPDQILHRNSAFFSYNPYPLRFVASLQTSKIIAQKFCVYEKASKFVLLKVNKNITL
jgi:hypothetical protein